ncbi:MULTISPECIES: ABC transporter ATP-binding protein [unclassified Azospirillum]|uniref:ABC transporter ATP-binding protein n=1 Tax=unclassified Azospirillum TaxID=2630922 RepID=UPI001FCD34C2|nr:MULTISPECIES: ATP-binding cassette domain-containing protein [unclassified Azospirillum]
MMSKHKGAALTLSQVSKRFGETDVLHGVDLSIEPGSFVAIIGKSGCGKSTLLRVILGLEPASTGHVSSDSDAAHARLVFQEPRLLPWASVAANVAVGLGERGDGPEGVAAAREALADVGLAAKADDWPSTLSGGQRQRVALARALVSHPTLLALDEPLGALDALTRIEMQSLLENVWQAQGFTALLVTHDVGEAVALADRVLLIDAGRVALDQPIDLPRPRRRGDAAFAALEGAILERLLDAPASAEAR